MPGACSCRNVLASSDSDVLIIDEASSETIVVWDLQDFVTFRVPDWQINSILGLAESGEISLGVEKILSLRRSADRIMIRCKTPAYEQDLEWLTFDKLSTILAMAERAKRFSSDRHDEDEKLKEWRTHFSRE